MENIQLIPHQTVLDTILSNILFAFVIIFVLTSIFISKKRENKIDVKQTMSTILIFGTASMISVYFMYSTTGSENSKENLKILIHEFEDKLISGEMKYKDISQIALTDGEHFKYPHYTKNPFEDDPYLILTDMYSVLTNTVNGVSSEKSKMLQDIWYKDFEETKEGVDDIISPTYSENP